MIVHSDITNNRKKVETTQMSIKGLLMHKMWYVHLLCVMLFNNEKKLNADKCYNMNEPWKECKWKETSHKRIYTV